MADSNNGNWQTARRWQQFLLDQYDVRIVKDWVADEHTAGDQVMIALHARRSATAIANWAASATQHPQRAKSLIVALTGTDLYRDIETDQQAQQSLALASQLIVLQDKAPEKVPDEFRHKVRVVFQSTTSRKALPKAQRRLRVVAVGHLRDEKMPQTLMEAAVHLRQFPFIFIDHIGGALDPELAEMAQATQAACPNYRWLGALPHEATRRRIQRAHALVHTSKMEGGAHVIMEAVCSGTPVLASFMDGNVGMLGNFYPGYFEVGNSLALANLLTQLDSDLRAGKPANPNKPNLTQRLQQACQQRAKLFTPEREQHDLLQAVQHAID